MKKLVLLSLLLLSLPAFAAHNVALTWTQTTDPVQLNCVFRASTAGGENLAGTALFCSTSPITSYTDSAVAAGDQWFYVVTAVSSKGVSSKASNEASAVIPLLPPTNLQANPQ